MSIYQFFDIYIDLSNFIRYVVYTRYHIERVLLSIPWHPRIFYVDTERKHFPLSLPFSGQPLRNFLCASANAPPPRLEIRWASSHCPSLDEMQMDELFDRHLEDREVCAHDLCAVGCCSNGLCCCCGCC